MIIIPFSIKHRTLDGAAFGTSLPHLLLQRYPEIATKHPEESYVPRIYGFKIHESAPELRGYFEGMTKFCKSHF